MCASVQEESGILRIFVLKVFVRSAVIERMQLHSRLFFFLSAGESADFQGACLAGREQEIKKEIREERKRIGKESRGSE